MVKTRLSTALLLVMASASAAAAQSYEEQWSPQLDLIGATATLQNSANSGAGITAGVVDTGVAADHVEFTGRVSTASTCVIAGCAAALATDDDNGHGTHVAGIIAAARNNYGMIGVAPGAALLSVKTLAASGTGYVSDVANGIRYAVDHGAQVLNLSMSFMPTPDLVAAINYAASKQAYIVFAGGNDDGAILGGGTAAGFTAQALQRLLFAGSTNLQKQLSSFSNIPGANGLQATSGQLAAFRNMWLMADGEAIWSASNYKDAQYLAAQAAGQPIPRNYYVQMWGTSMAAPQLTGALVLLAARWPFLLKSGTAAQILVQSADDMGAAGADDTYGAGFLDLTRAFQPIGTLRVVSASGATLSPTVSGTRLLGRGPVGDLHAVAASLSNTIALDSFNRDFPVSLAGAVASRQAATHGASLATGSTVTSRTYRFAGDAAFTLTLADNDAILSPIHPMAFAESAAGRPPDAWSFAFSSHDAYAGAGRGIGVALDLTEARWGGPSAFAGQGGDLSSALLGLSDQTGYAYAGAAIGAHSRLTMAFTQSSDEMLSSMNANSGTSTGFAASYTFEPRKGWKVSVTSTYLDEHGLLLGSAGSGALALAGSGSASVGIGTNYAIAEDWQLGFDSVFARTDGTRNAASLITGTSPLFAMGFGAALRREHLTEAGDAITFALRKPLRVYAGHADLTVPVGLDFDGNVVSQHQSASLVPQGSETALSLDYARPVAESAAVAVSLTYRQDADNIAGRNAVGAMVRFRTAF